MDVGDALLLRPLPVARPGEVLTVGSTRAIEAFGASALVSSYRDYVDIRDRSKSFEGLAAFTDFTAGFASDPKASPKLKMGMLVSGNLLPLMGVGLLMALRFAEVSVGEHARGYWPYVLALLIGRIA